MSDKIISSKAVLRFSDENPDSASVSAEVLVRSIEALQQITYLLGAYHENQQLRERFAPSLKLRRRFTLKCEIPRPGSYIFPVSLDVPAGELPFPDGPIAVLSEIQDVLEGLVKESAGVIEKIVRDSRYRDRILQEIIRLLPRSGENWNLGFAANGRDAITLSSKSARVAKKWGESPVEPEEELITITGELVAIEFENHFITVRYPPTKREIQCSYLPEIEETLFERRRDLVQVTGKFTLDSEGHPVKLTEVSCISDVDLNTMTFSSIPYLNGQLKFNVPLVLNPELDETKQLLIIDYPDFDLHVYSATREGLEEEIISTMAFLWDSYGKEDPKKLTVEAQALRERLLQNIAEMPNVP